MHFAVIGEITNISIIASGKSIRELHRLIKIYGGHNWRKMRGTVKIRLSDSRVVDAEIHWYECHGIGRKELKIKKYI